MTSFSDMLTVAGACAGILLLVLMIATPPAVGLSDRAGRRRLPAGAVGSLPVSTVGGHGPASAVPVIPRQRSLSTVSRDR